MRPLDPPPPKAIIGAFPDPDTSFWATLNEIAEANATRIIKCLCQRFCEQPTQLALWANMLRTPSDTEGSGLRTICMADVQLERMDWLWQRRIPQAKLSIIDGDPGLGKTLLMLDVAARLTTGKPMPGCELPPTCSPATVIVLTAEDGLGDTIKPRLIAAGADQNRVHAIDITHALPSLPNDASLLEECIQDLQARLVILDPLSALLSDTINTNTDHKIRRALTPMASVAQTTGAAIVLIRHLNKTGGTDPLYRGVGSIGINAAARSQLLVVKDPNDQNRRVLAVVKNNLAALPPSLTYTVESWSEDPEVPRVVWGETCSLSAKQLLAADQQDRGPSRLEEAKELLKEQLATGPKWETELVALAAQADISRSTLKRARQAIGVRSQREGDHWELYLPDSPEQTPEKTPAKEDQTTAIEPIS